MFSFGQLVGMLKLWHEWSGQNHATYALGLDILGEPAGGATLPWAQLNNHKLTLSYVPSTSADEAVLYSFLPMGTFTDISQLPANLPAYLISVTPKLKLDGQEIAEGKPMGLGEEMTLKVTIQRPGKPKNSAESIIPAGSYVALVSVGGSIHSDRLANLQSQITSTHTVLQSGDPVQLANINREDILGDMFYSGLVGYFAQYLSLGYVAGLSQGVKQNLLPSGGIYGYLPKVNYFFSIPTAVDTGAVEMDLFNISTTTMALDADKQKRYNYMRNAGTLLSTLEHAIPEQMFATLANPGEAISAVKAISKASAAGQRIYQITQANQAITLPRINHNSQVIGEIAAAVNAGKLVITHTDAVSVPGWTGAGYIILDTELGDGAYKISGGSNGGNDKLPSDIEKLVHLSSAGMDIYGGITEETKTFVTAIQKSIIEFFDKTKLFGIASAVYDFGKSVSKLNDVCHGLDFAAAVTIQLALAASLLLLAPLFAATPIGFIFAVVLSVILAFAFDALVNAQLNVCRR